MFLERLGFKRKIHVGISVSANSIIELVCVDEKTKSVVKYVSGNIKYNNAVREIMDFNEFTEIIEGLFDEAALEPTECSVALNIPNVMLGISVLDNPSDKPYIEDNLSEELSDLYIFKRNEPTIKYELVNSDINPNVKNIIYGAVQTKIISNILDAFDTLGVEITRIETSYTSMIKTLLYCDRFNRLIRKDNSSIVLLVTPNTCSSFYLKGQTLSGITEEPLAVKSFSIDEVYSVISKIATNAISKNKPQALLIISEADEVNAEQIARNISFNGDIDCINKSSHQSEEFIEINPLADIDKNIVSYLTIEAVGAAISDFDEYELDLNFLPAERIPKNVIKIGDLEGSLYLFVGFCVASAIIVALIIFGIAKLILGSQISSMNSLKDKSNESINVFKSNIAKQDQNKESVFPILQQISDNNRKVIDVYNGLSSEIPQDIFIKRFVVNPQGGIGILGESRSSDAVNNFIKGLKEKDQDLMVSKLSLNDPTIDPTSIIPDGVTFEIKTSTVDVQFIGDVLQNEYNEIEQMQKMQQEQSQNNNAVRPGRASRDQIPARPPII